ncbi:tRNA lysidine(34) synthetase TilS [Buchnera aphidicola]|uniref:tRNA lysidine(34) synthetase TilS n=1 Tax=Buchnera aphidicola TaxID=9 RepID=UPI003463E4EB
MIKNFINSIKKYQKILLSYSGGLDSTVLLYQLLKFTNKYPFIKIRAIYIDHQINPQSDIWNQHCKQVCKKKKIEFISKKIKIQNQKNIQSIARKLRYQAIKESILPEEILVTGHHLNDQCENLFLSLKRGSGLNGISGISYVSIFHKKQNIIRPLLPYSKIELKNWAVLNKIKWIEDDSNLCDKYDRNFIRNKIIYKIQKKWPFFIKNCFKSMKICKNEIKSLNEFLDTMLKKYSTFNNILHTKIFKNIKTNTKILLIRRWIYLYQKIIISYKKTQEIYQFLINHDNEKTKHKVNIQNFQINKYKNQLFQIPINPSIKNLILFWKESNKPLKLPQELGNINQDPNGTKIIHPKKNDLVNIRFQTEKKILIHEKYKKKIKIIWQENNIPPWMRNKIPCLFYNNELVSILGILVLPKYQYNNSKKKYWKISWSNYIT